MGRPKRNEVFTAGELGLVHVVQRCVRRAWLAGVDAASGKDFSFRREWIRRRMEALASVMAIDVLTYAILSNHVHLVLRNRPDVVAAWSDEEVALRWLRVFPGRQLDEQLAEPTENDVRTLAGKAERIAEIRLRELDSIFAVEVAAFAILDSHMHVVLKLNDAVAAEWSDEDVVRRWGRLFPPRGKDRQPLEVSEGWAAAQLKDVKWVAETRKRLNSLGWFMKCLKEPLARMANKEDGCKGTFFEGRYKSIAILDEEALLTTLAYVDLNLVAAGVAKTPEESEHTSVKARGDHCREQGSLNEVVDQPQDRTKHDLPLEDQAFWLVPIADRRPQFSVGSVQFSDSMQRESDGGGVSTANAVRAGPLGAGLLTSPLS